MLCSRCGYSVHDDAVFCPQCGYNPQEDYGATGATSVDGAAGGPGMPAESVAGQHDSQDAQDVTLERPGVVYTSPSASALASVMEYTADAGDYDAPPAGYAPPESEGTSAPSEPASSSAAYPPPNPFAQAAAPPPGSTSFSATQPKPPQFYGSYPKAGLVGRLGAALIDSVIASAFFGPASLLLIAALLDRSSIVLASVAFGVAAIWSLAYSLGRDAFGGASWGRQIVGQVVVSRETGAPASFGATIVRQFILQVLNLIPGIGSLVEPVLVLVDGSGLRLGDRAAGTQVVSTAEVQSRGHAVKQGKRIVAYGVLAIALLVGVLGGVLGTVRLISSIERYGADWESALLELSQGGELPQAVIDGVGDEPSDEETSTAVTFTPDPSTLDLMDEKMAFDVVEEMLSFVRIGQMESAGEFMTGTFPEEYERYLGGSLPLRVTVEKAFRDVSSYVVIVEEIWPSGARRMYYFVAMDDGQPRVYALKDRDRM